MSSLANIRTDVVVQPPRIVLLGAAKTGKSTLASTAPAPIFLPIRGEEGVDGLGVARFPVAMDLPTVIDSLTTLIQEEHPYQTVVIDSVSALEPLIHEYVCKEANVASIDRVGAFGKGYADTLRHVQMITQYLDALRNRNLGVILIGHVKVRRFDDPAGESYDRYEMDCNDKVGSTLMRWCDALWFMNTKTLVKKEEVGGKIIHTRGIDPMSGARFVYTQPRPSHPGGGRGLYGTLPYEVQVPAENGFSFIMSHAQNK